MTQNWPPIPNTNLVSESRADLLARDESLKSNFSGTSFPSSDLSVGMMCYRTDLLKWYGLVSTGPAVWEELVRLSQLGSGAFAATGVSGATIPLNSTANTFAQTLTLAAANALDVGANKIIGSGGDIRFGNNKVMVNAGDGNAVEFAINGTTRVTVSADGGLVVGSPTGGTKGAGTINVQNIYKNGVAVGTAAFVDTGTGPTQVPLNSNLGALAYKAAAAGSDLASGAIPAGVGFTAGSYNAGTKASGTFTPNPLQGNFQHAVNGGAHTLAPPSAPCSILIEYTNNNSAGAINTSGFTKVRGDQLTTTNGHKFWLVATKANGYSLLQVIALQ